MVGKTISHYRIVSQLGAGGMGVLYRAEDVRLGRSVALKFVSTDLGGDARAVQRLRAEARAASALNHANICTIYDIDEHDGHPFIVMELMKGKSLRECLSGGPLKIHQVLDVGIETADALHAAHTEGIIHRDIKPGNIFMTERGHVKVLDFGLAKLTALFESSRTTHEVAERTTEGVTLGTVAYMSPEQATGEELDGRTDLFSLGVVLYECATGRQPFSGKTSAAILAAILNRAPVAPVVLNPDLPSRLQDVINNCLEKDRELRYQSAADLRADLKRVRRDIESGRSEAVPAIKRHSGTIRETDSTRQSAPATATVSAGIWGRSWVAATAVVLTLVGAGSYLFSVREPRPVLESRAVVPAADPTVPSLVALANASVDARNYRAAISYAEQALARDPENDAARKVRASAQQMLSRLDDAIADGRRRLAARDVRGAERALETARGIDPGASAVTELAFRVAEQSRRQEPVPAKPAPVQSSERTQAPAPAPAVPPPPPPARVETRPLEPQPSAVPSLGGTSTIPAPTSPQPAPPPAKPVAETAAATPAEEDEAAIRRVIATYARAIEAKDVALFRSIKPNLSREEERRLEEGFLAVTSQRVSLTVLSIDRRGDRALVMVRRRDTIVAGGRQQAAERQQTMTLARRDGDWTIVDIR